MAFLNPGDLITFYGFIGRERGVCLVIDVARVSGERLCMKVTFLQRDLKLKSVFTDWKDQNLIWQRIEEGPCNECRRDG